MGYWRDSSARLTFTLPGVAAANYPTLCRSIADALGLVPDGDILIGTDQMFWNFRRGDQVVGLDWDPWMEFMAVARSDSSEPLLRDIAVWLSSCQENRQRTEAGQGSDHALIQGAWEVTDVTGLTEEDAEDAKRGGYWFEGDRLITGDEEAAWEWTFRLDEDSCPKRLLSWSDDDRFPYSPNALYQFEGDDLLLCYNPRTKEPPGTLEATPDSGNVILRLVRSTRPTPH